MKWRGKRDTTWNIPRSITFSPLHFMSYRGKSITFGTVCSVRVPVEGKWETMEECQECCENAAFCNLCTGWARTLRRNAAFQNNLSSLFFWWKKTAGNLAFHLSPQIRRGGCVAPVFRYINSRVFHAAGRKMGFFPNFKEHWSCSQFNGTVWHEV